MFLPAGPGTYVLILRLREERCLLVGHRGKGRFEAGYYAYVGSALGGLAQRVSRHFRHDKRLRWHIDYLVQATEVLECWLALGRERRECVWARALANMPGLVPSLSRFGSSDCACPTHLFYSQALPDVDVFRGATGEWVEVIAAQRGNTPSSQENTASSTAVDQTLVD